MPKSEQSKFSFYDVLRTSASILAIGAVAFVAPAYAQETADEEVVVVRGIRASLQSAQSIKQNAEQIVDSITAVDIGALPDRSVSEALQRVPGLTLQRTNENRDPARLASEGGAVFIRGLSWVRSETNGRDIFSASNGRTLSFEDVSADLLAGVDVYKNPSAELIEGGIGGIVNLRTRLPFDQSGQLVAGSIDYNYGDLLDEGFLSGNALYSNRWEVGGLGEIGILASVSLANVGNRTDSIQAGRFESRTLGAPQDGLAAGDEVYIPPSIGFRRIDWEQERSAFSGAVQWAPTNDLTFTLQALYAQAEPVDVEHAMDLGGAFGGTIPTDNSTYTFDDDNAISSGTYNDASISANTRYGRRKSTTADISLGFRYLPEGPWSFSGDLQYVESDAEVLSMTAFSQLGLDPIDVAGRPEVTFDFRGDDPLLSISNQATAAMQDQYWWAAAMDHIQDNDASSWAGRLDAEYSFPDDGFVRSFRMGVRGTQRDAVTRQSGYNWALLSQQFWGSGGGAPVYLDETGYTGGPQNPGLPDQSELFTYDNFFRGDIAVPGVGWFPVEELLYDTANSYSYLQSTLSSGWGWAPLEAPGAYDLNPRGDNVSAGINRQSEDTSAFYGLLRFGDDDGSIFGTRMDGNVGVRIVSTETAAIGRSSAGGLAAACTGSPSADCASANAFITAFNAALGSYQSFENSYTNVLPSANLRFFLSDDLQLRLAASRALVRPSFSQTRPYYNISFAFTGDQFTTTVDPNAAYPFTGTASAPDLRPTLADQLDASLEWYFSPTGSLSFAAFYKSITDYIAFQPQNPVTLNYGGEEFTFEVNQQINASEGTLKGFEIAYTQFFDFLPGWMSGFGMQANYTYIDNEGGVNTALNPFEAPQQDGALDATLPIEGMSPSSYNIAAMYERYGISARLAYNWRERFLLTTSAANINRPVWSEDYGQLDGSVFYSINEHVKVGLQGTNLLNARTYLNVGNTTLAPRYSWTDTDRRIAFAVRANF